MKSKSKLILTTISVLVVLAMSGAYVRSVRAKYRYACGKLDGFPGVLQRVYLIPGLDTQCQQSATPPHAPCANISHCHVPINPGTALDGNCGAISPTICGCVPNNQPEPVLTITKTHSGNFTQGDVGKTYKITVTNNGTAATSGAVSVTDSLPSGLVATAMNGTNWNCTQPAGPCTRSDVLAAGSSYENITVTVNVACNAPNSVTNNAAVSGGGSGGGSASDPTTIDTGNSTPTIACPGAISKFADPGQPGAFINPGTPVINGGCSTVALTGVRSDGKSLGALYPIGTTLINWTATDANQRTASCSQTIIVMVESSPNPRKNP